MYLASAFIFELGQNILRELPHSLMAMYDNKVCCIIGFRHLDEKKKKCKAGKVETHLEFPGREKVKFGEVVEAPPKLSFPKVPSLLKTLYDIRFGPISMKG